MVINENRLALEEIKFLQKLREKKSGVPAVVKTGQAAAASGGNNAGGLVSKGGGDKGEGDGEKDDLVLQDTFAQETAVLDEDPHMYVPLPSYYVHLNSSKNVDNINFVVLVCNLRYMPSSTSLSFCQAFMLY